MDPVTFNDPSSVNPPEGRSRYWTGLSVNPVLRMVIRSEGAAGGEEIEMSDTMSEIVTEPLEDIVPQKVQAVAFLCDGCGTEMRLIWEVSSNNEERTPMSQGWNGVAQAVTSFEAGRVCRMWVASRETRTVTSQNSNRGFEAVCSILTESSGTVCESNFRGYLNIMSRICLSPYDGDGPTRNRILPFFRRLLCGSSCLISIIQALRMIKHYTFVFLGEAGQMKSYSDMIFYGNRLCTRLSHIYVMTFRQPAVVNVIKSIGEVQQEREAVTGQRRKPKRLFSILLALTTILLLIGRVVLGQHQIGKPLSLNATIEEGAILMGRGIFAWNPFNYNNDTLQIEHEYVDDMTSTTTLLATGTALLNYCGWAQDTLLTDMMLSLAMDLHDEMSAFVETITKKGIAAAETAAEKRGKLRWLMAIRKSGAAMNTLFGLMIIWMHASNLLLVCRTIMSQVTHRWMFHTLFRLVNSLKIGVTYVYAVLIRNMNDPIIRWLKKNKDMENYVDENGDVVSVEEIIEDMEKQPICLGIQGMIIDAGFIKQFVAAAISLILFMVQYLEKKTSCDCECNCGKE